jgi:polyisoprenoid-binding protein YceI
MSGLGRVSGTVAVRAGTVDVVRPALGQVTAQVDAGSFETGNPRRDRDVRGPRYLASVNHPTIAFQGGSIRMAPRALSVS